jgi:alcohol dehydrogenase (cytochrome c)
MGMVPTRSLVAFALLSIVLIPGLAPAADWRPVTDERLANAERDPANWLMYNRTYNGWRYSRLDQITTTNVTKLVPKWIFSGGALGEQQATPIVNDGSCS